MKVPPQQSDTFAKNPPSGIKAVLVYGTDSGLVNERATALTVAVIGAKDDPLRVSRFTYDTIKQNPVLLSDAVFALSFWGGKRLIKVEGAPAALPKEIQQILETIPEEVLVIFCSDELSPSSSLRKFFEQENYTAALACYKDEGASIRKLIIDTLKERGFHFDQEILLPLETAIAGDRLLIRSELEKLLLYMGEERHIRLQHVEACIGEPLEASMEILCHEVASGRMEMVTKECERLLREGVSVIAIIRMLSRYFMRLQLVKAAVEQGKSETEAMAMLKPPVFFKHANLFQQHVRQWSLSKLSNVLKGLLQLEAECKKTGVPAQLLCEHMLTMMAVHAGRKNN